MGRILFFLLLGLALYLLWRSMQSRDGGKRTSRPPEPALQAMVSCAKCGLHIPRHEALPLGDRFFCCEEHRRNAPSA